MALTDNHFELFGLAPGFGLDQTQLSQSYRELQRSVHPDRYASAPERERRESLQRASQINEAFQVLRDPLKRGYYLLELRGRGQDHAAPETDPGLLMEQMELREALEEAKHSAHPGQTVTALLDQVERKISVLVGQISAHFAADQLDAAAGALRKLQFFRRVQDEALALEEDLN